jgi:hypothetical protein
MCGRCPLRERSAHVGAAGTGGRRQTKGRMWPPAEPPTPCGPRAYDCALVFSALHRASGACRWRSVRACVRTRCLDPRRAGARFCFRGSRAMPPPVASRWRMRCLWYAVASLSCHPRTTWRAGGVARCVTCEQEHGGLCVLTGRLSPDGLNSNPKKRRTDRAHHDVQGPRGKRAYWLDPAWGSNRPPPSPAIQPTPAPAHPIGLFWKRQEHPSPPPSAPVALVFQTRATGNAGS